MDKKEEVITDYGKIYDVHDVFTLLDDMPKGTMVTCSADDNEYQIVKHGDLYTIGEGGDVIYFEELHDQRDFINATFKLVKPTAEKEETWTPCTFSQAVVNFATNKRNIENKGIVFDVAKISRDNLLKEINDKLTITEITEGTWRYLEV